MSTTIIIALCVLLLIAYVFDLSAARTKIPSVILLLALGWLVRQSGSLFGFSLPAGLSHILPILGTIGLILIVLEGALELELNKSKLRVISKSFFVALVPFLLASFIFTWFLWYLKGYSVSSSLINAIPFCVISSAIAIPSARNLSAQQKEFVIYESSLSDIIGVLLFNFLAVNEAFTAQSVGIFILQLLIMALVSFIATTGLSYLLYKIDHHVKFIPIILLVLLVYAVAKLFHLPSLIFILLFGLFLGNLDELSRYKWMERFRLKELDNEVKKFRDITTEVTFLIRSLFFLLFGYLIETSELINLESLSWAAACTAILFLLRAAFLAIVKLPMRPLLFIAPRGLITILLYLSIDSRHAIPVINNSLVIQVIILTGLLMAFGLMISNTEKKDLK